MLSLPSVRASFSFFFASERALEPAAQQAAEVDGRGLPPRGRRCSTPIVVASRAAAAERRSVGLREEVLAGALQDDNLFLESPPKAVFLYREVVVRLEIHPKLLRGLEIPREA